MNDEVSTLTASQRQFAATTYHQKRRQAVVVPCPGDPPPGRSSLGGYVPSEGRQLVPSAYSPPPPNYQRQLHAEHLARQARFLLNAIAFQRSEREGPSCSWPNPAQEFLWLSREGFSCPWPDGRSYYPTIDKIIDSVCTHFSIDKIDILSARRTAEIVKPRHIGMYLAKVLTPKSLPQIGRHFGGRDHTTVLSAIRRIASLIGDEKNRGDYPPAFDPDIAAAVATLRSEI